MTKTIFVAGASGAIGRRLCPLLVGNGWRVIGTTRSAEKVALLQQMGVEPAVINVFDSDGLIELLAAIRPQVVIHQLTDLPPALEPSKMPDALKRNARLRDQGTRNLLAAAIAAGATRVIAQSIAFLYAEGPTPHRESDPLLALTHPVYGETVTGVTSLERQVTEAPLEGLVLRYGFLYGPGTGFEAAAGAGSVHVDAAAKAAELAVTHGESGIYNVAETDGALNCEKAIHAFGWDVGWRSRE